MQVTWYMYKHIIFLPVEYVEITCWVGDFRLAGTVVAGLAISSGGVITRLQTVPTRGTIDTIWQLSLSC